MSVIVTERRSEGSLQRTLRAVRVFEVSGVSTRAEAEAAVAAQFSVAPNASYPEDVSLRARIPEASNPEPSFFVLRYEYVPLPSSNGNDNGPKKYPIIKWEVGNSTEPVDYDADGNPIVNSAKDPFDPPPQRQFGTWFLRVITLEDFYDLPRALSYQNTVNEDAFTLFNYGTVQHGQCLCHSIQPAQAYVLGDSPIEIEYVFEFRADGFDHRILDQGYYGFYREERGRIWTPSGEASTVMVRLNGRGKPIAKDFTIEGNTPMEANFSVLPPDQIQSTSDGVWLRYRRYKRRPFAGGVVSQMSRVILIGS